MTSGVRSRRIEAERRRHRQRRTLARVRTAVVLTCVIAVLTGCVWVAYQSIMSARSGSQVVADYPGPGNGSVEFTINPGDTGQVIGENLVDLDVVKSIEAFLEAWNANAQSLSIQPGTYDLKKQMRAVDVIAALLDESKRSSNAVTVSPGLTATQIAERLKSFARFSAEDVDAAMKDTAGMGLPAEAGGNPEGWLAAGSYEVSQDETPVDVLARMVAGTVSMLDELKVPAEQRQEVLTKASIIDKEVPIDRYGAKVARVIQNRLDHPEWETAGFLNIDATVYYGLGKYGGQLTAEELARDTPYNTYIHKGLPPTPICSPSRDSIDAALHPEDGNWLYYVTVNFDTGETKFADTLAEHDEYVSELRAWCDAHEGKC